MNLDGDVELLLEGHDAPSDFAGEAGQRRGARQEIHIDWLSHVLGDLVDPGCLYLSETFQGLAYSRDESIEPGALGIE
jgi:hypothetical protein